MGFPAWDVGNSFTRVHMRSHCFEYDTWKKKNVNECLKDIGLEIIFKIFL